MAERKEARLKSIPLRRFAEVIRATTIGGSLQLLHGLSQTQVGRSNGRTRAASTVTCPPATSWPAASFRSAPPRLAFQRARNGLSNGHCTDVTAGCAAGGHCKRRAVPGRRCVAVPQRPCDCRGWRLEHRSVMLVQSGREGRSVGAVWSKRSTKVTPRSERRQRVDRTTSQSEKTSHTLAPPPSRFGGHPFLIVAQHVESPKLT